MAVMRATRSGETWSRQPSWTCFTTDWNPLCCLLPLSFSPDFCQSTPPFTSPPPVILHPPLTNSWVGNQFHKGGKCHQSVSQTQGLCKPALWSGPAHVQPEPRFSYLPRETELWTLCLMWWCLWDSCSFSGRLIHPQYNKGKLLQIIIPAIARLFNTQSIHITITHIHTHTQSIHIYHTFTTSSSFFKSLFILSLYGNMRTLTLALENTHLSPCFVVPPCPH